MKKGLPKKSFISDHLGFTVTRMVSAPKRITMRLISLKINLLYWSSVLSYF